MYRKHIIRDRSTCHEPYCLKFGGSKQLPNLPKGRASHNIKLKMTLIQASLEDNKEMF